jgi:protein-S-isoprenylcysteine O-methyltransferase Ste14
VDRRTAAIGSGVFFVVAPCVVAGAIPYWLTGWRVRPMAFGSLSWLVVPVRVAGAVLLLAGAAVLVHAFVRFAVEGIGTPAPIAPPQHLVVGGLYRYVRNPMYVGLVAAIVGQALLLGQPNLLVYAVVVWAATAAFVLGYEQPALRQQFGAEYDAYRAAVPAWVPRWRPWDPDKPRDPDEELRTPSSPRP